jgi:uncharacterized membrane protein YjfL (UPF0719 family)
MEDHVTSLTSTLAAIDAAYFKALGQGIGAIALYAILGVLLILLGFYAVDITTPGKLNELVRAGAPNAVAVTAAGMVSMAFIVVIAIFSAGGRLAEGLLSALVYGLVGIVVQVGGVRVLEYVTGINIGQVLRAELFTPSAIVVCAGHVALGLVVAVAIL